MSLSGPEILIVGKVSVALAEGLGMRIYVLYVG